MKITWEIDDELYGRVVRIPGKSNEAYILCWQCTTNGNRHGFTSLRDGMTILYSDKASLVEKLNEGGYHPIELRPTQVHDALGIKP